MYRFACRYSIFRRYQPVWYGIDSLELKTFQAYFNEMGVQYGDDFEDFLKQAMLLFLGLDFSQIQINTLVPMTFAGDDVPNKEQTDLEKAEAVGLEGKGTDG